MTGVADTSRMAFSFCKAHGITASQQTRIVECLVRVGRPMTRAEIELGTGIRLSSVCGAVNALVKRKALVELPWRICPVTGFRAHLLTLPHRLPHLLIVRKPTQVKLI